MHITAQHHLSSHSIRSPKPKKTSSLNSQDSPMNSQLKKISPLASSKFQALPFGSPLLLQILRTSASSLPAHFASHPFSHFAVEPCSPVRKATIISTITQPLTKYQTYIMFVTCSYTSAHAML